MMPTNAPLAGFERFERQRSSSRQGGTIIVSVHRKYVYLSRAAHALMGEPERVVWLFNAEQKRVGLCASDDRGASYPVSGKNNLVAAGRFFMHYGISPPAITRVVAVYDAESGILSFDVSPFMQSSPAPAAGEGEGPS